MRAYKIGLTTLANGGAIHQMTDGTMYMVAPGKTYQLVPGQLQALEEGGFIRWENGIATITEKGREAEKLNHE